VTQKKRTLLAVAVAIAFLTTFALFSFGQTAQPFLTRHVRPEVSSGQAPLVGRLPANQTLHFDVVLALRDRVGLQNFLTQLYDPTSAFYHQFITPQEFTARFGPTQQDWDTLVNFAQASGLEVIGGTRDGRDLWLSGAVSDIEKAFHVTLGVYQDPSENRQFFAVDREPTVNLPFQPWHVTGLDNDSKPHAMYVKQSDKAKAKGTNSENTVSNITGSGPSGNFYGSDMRAAYYCGGTCGSGALTGSGQNIALFEFAGADLTDLSTYYSKVGQTEPYIPTLISTGGYATACLDSGSSKCDDTEQTIDMTQAMSMAPGSTMLYMYVCGDVLANNTGNISDTACISAMVSTTDAPLSMQIGCSWGWTPADASTLDPYFEQMASQGQNFFAAAGDSSAWSASNEAWPADDANIVSVGGTDLTTSGAAGPWSSETAWADSGGGISPDSIPIPSWQQLSGVITSSNKGSTTLRNGPDVAANANFSFYYCADQKSCTTGLGGTSFAAPMWAGYLALANQQAAANGESIGFINPIIYPAALTGSYGTYLHDVPSGSCGTYSAITGYDLCTGWGSPNGSGMINLLAPTGGQTAQTITFTTNAPSSAAYNSQFTVAATASSGLAVSFTSSGSCTNSGATYTMTSGAGSCSVIANQAGNSSYSAAPTVTQTTTATTASQTITFTTNAPSSAAYNSQFTVAATASSGLSVAFTSSGGCSNSGATYTMTSGTTACSVIANQSGNTNYSAATQVTETTNATLASQTITFTTNAPPSAYAGNNFTVAATASSGLAVTFTSSGGCTNSGATYTMTNSATACSVIANQAGNGNYAAAPTVTQTTLVGQVWYDLSSPASPPSTAPYGSSFYTVTGTTTCELPVTYTASGVCSVGPTTEQVVGGIPEWSATYTMTSGAGTCTLQYSVAGNSSCAAIGTINWMSTTATKATNTVTLSNVPASAVYGSNFTVAASGQGTGAITYTSGGGCSNSGATYTMTSGTTACTVTATQAADTNYASGSASQSTGAILATNTVTFTTAPPASAAYNSSFTVAASGKGTGAITYGSGGGCSNTGANYTMTSGTTACTVTATQAADNNYNSANASQNVTATKIANSVTFTTAPPASAAYNSGFTVAASGKGTGAITYTNGGSCSNAGASYTMTSGSGSCTVTATQAADNNYNSGSTSQSVNATLAANTVSLSGVPASAEYGSSFAISASGLGSGTVTYSSGGACTNSGATYTMTSGAGSCTVTATQAADSNYASGSASASITATSANASVGVISGLNPSLVGQSVTFTATVTSDTNSVKGRTDRSGRVKSNVLSGTVTWSSNTGCSASTISGYPGTATCTTSTLSVGTDTITATYSGDSNHNGASGTVSGGQVVNPLNATSTSVASSLDPSTYGQAVNFTANVSGSGSPTGTVQFSVDGSAFGSPVTLASGTATSANISTLAAGTHTVTAAYSGDSANAASSGTLGGGQTVNVATSGVSVGSSLNPSGYGQAVTFTATINGEYGLLKHRGGKAKSNDVTGTVAWSSNTGCGTTSVTSGNPGTATCTTSSLPVGTESITATYSGDANHNGGSGSVSQQVSENASTTTVSSTLNPSVYGQAVSFTANVTAGATGTVQFNIDGSAFGSPVTLVSGTASSGSISTLAVGSHTVTAVYSGDSNYAGSTGTLAGGQTVNSASAGMSLTSTLNPSNYGQSVTFTATINGQYGLITRRGANAKSNDVTGTVTWSSNTGCGTTTVASGNPGTATCATSSLGGGTDVITANYSGDANHNGGSATLNGGQVVNPASQTITFTTNAPSSAVYNSSFTVAASASSGLAVAFTSAGSCTNAGATYTVTSGSGTCFVIANQLGNANYTAAPQITQTANATKATPTVTFTGLPASLPYNNTYTLVATTNASTTASITDSTSTVCSLSGSTVTILKDSGTCTVKATWAADANYNSATLSQSGTAAKGTPVITWGTPAPIDYGVKLSSTQLNASANIAGTFKYTPASGKIEDAGNITLSTTFTPTNKNYSTATASVTLQVLLDSTTISVTSPSATITLGKTGTASTTGDFTVTSYKPTGLVTLTASGPGLSTETCTGTVASATGKGSCKLTFSQTGEWTLTASYPGDANHTGSNSSGQTPPVTVTVN
jgi:kumamolisin